MSHRDSFEHGDLVTHLRTQVSTFQLWREMGPMNHMLPPGHESFVDDCDNSARGVLWSSLGCIHLSQHSIVPCLCEHILSLPNMSPRPVFSLGDVSRECRGRETVTSTCLVTTRLDLGLLGPGLRRHRNSECGDQNRVWRSLFLQRTLKINLKFTPETAQETSKLSTDKGACQGSIAGRG